AVACVTRCKVMLGEAHGGFAAAWRVWDTICAVAPRQSVGEVLMPRALPLPLREQVIDLRCQGHSPAAVAHALHVKERTVRHLWGRYQQRGRAGLETGYGRSGRPACRFPAELVEAALALKRQHPRWGAGFIRIELAERF